MVLSDFKVVSDRCKSLILTLDPDPFHKLTPFNEEDTLKDFSHLSENVYGHARAHTLTPTQKYEGEYNSQND